MTERVVLAFSGGLDTSVAIPYLAERTGAEVIAVAVNVGQGGEDMNVIRQRALDCGAVEAEVVDAREEFAADYCIPALRANALYMDRYPLVSALSRPLIVKHLVAAAAKHGGTIVSHGCTGKGNDQVRFEVGIGALAPHLKVIAPARDYAWTRDKAIAYAEEKNLPIDVTHKSPYSIDQNLWGRAVETGFLEDIWNGPIEDEAPVVGAAMGDALVGWAFLPDGSAIRSPTPAKSQRGTPVATKWSKSSGNLVNNLSIADARHIIKCEGRANGRRVADRDRHLAHGRRVLARYLGRRRDGVASLPADGRAISGAADCDSRALHLLPASRVAKRRHRFVAVVGVPGRRERRGAAVQSHRTGVP